MKRLPKFIVGAFVAVIGFGLILSNGPTQALSSIWIYGPRTGYFNPGTTNIHSCYEWDPGGSNRDCFVIPEGLYGVNSVGALMAVLMNNYNQGGARQIGAAYIVHSMLGQVQGSTGVGVSAAQWADLQSRLNYADSYGGPNWHGISWNEYHQTWNDGGLTDRGPDVYIANGVYQDGGAIVIRDRAGNPVYALFIQCANPDGDLTNGIPSLNFTLNPAVSVTPNQAAEAGTSVNITGTVTNTGSSTSTDASWQLTTFVVPPAPAALPGGGQDVAAPTAHYGHAASIIQQGVAQFPQNTTTTAILSQPLPDVPVGSRVCYALSVSPYTQSDSRWNNSTPDVNSCVVISKKPKVQVLSGDLQVGRGSATYPANPSANVITSTSTKGGSTYGSWAEYGIIPSGTVTGMASGAGYAGGSPTTNMCSLSVLTFTSGSTGGNSCGATIGKYVQATIAPNVSARFPINVPANSATPTNPANPASLPGTTVNITGNNLSGQYQAPAGATAITITGGNSIPAGRWVVINAPNATVTITNNITYTNAPLHALADIPQVVIIAKNILVADNVTQIDSWLVAVGSGVDGRLNTCGAGGVTETSALTFKDCAQKLTVNGPVIANHLIMRRTAGSDPGAASGAPAEAFNLRPDAYIWATNYNQNSGRLSTVATQELPPRF